MEQNISFEIVGELLKGESHPRMLAKKLGTNHMTASRKLKKLVSENVVDYRMEGKNKVYFLKKTPESKGYVMMTEHYKLNKTLARYPFLRNIIENLRENPEIKLALLFGSHAKNTAKKDSDIDVYIETKNNKIKKEVEMLNTRLNVKIGAYDKSSSLIREIEKNHVIVKGVEQYYEKNRFFG